MATKTNAVRLVRQAGISCREAFYEFDENDLNGNHAAQAIGKPAEEVFKTLVARGQRTGISVFCIPVCCELNLKKAAKAAGDKNMEMVAVKELLNLTGYIRGGCTAIGMKKQFKTFIHESAKELDTFCISAGHVGNQIQVSVSEVVNLVRAEFADLIC